MLTSLELIRNRGDPLQLHDCCNDEVLFFFYFEKSKRRKYREQNSTYLWFSKHLIFVIFNQEACF